MIVAVYGKCNGADVILAKNGERWETAVPVSRSGEYIIELWAESDSGSTAYMAALKVVYDSSRLRARVEVIEIGAEFTVEQVLSLLNFDNICGSPADRKIMCAVLPELIRCAVAKCEVCGI